MQVTNDPVWWANIEWAVGAIATIALAIGGFVWRVLWRIGRHEMAIQSQRTDFEQLKTQTRLDVDKLGDKIDLLTNEHHALRNTLASQPTKGDLHEMETRLGTQIDRFADKLDRLIESRAAPRPRSSG